MGKRLRSRAEITALRLWQRECTSRCLKSQHFRSDTLGREPIPGEWPIYEHRERSSRSSLAGVGTSIAFDAAETVVFLGE